MDIEQKVFHWYKSNYQRRNSKRPKRGIDWARAHIHPAFGGKVEDLYPEDRDVEPFTLEEVEQKTWWGWGLVAQHMRDHVEAQRQAQVAEEAEQMKGTLVDGNNVRVWLLADQRGDYSLVFHPRAWGQIWDFAAREWIPIYPQSPYPVMAACLKDGVIIVEFGDKKTTLYAANALLVEEWKHKMRLEKNWDALSQQNEASMPIATYNIPNVYSRSRNEWITSFCDEDGNVWDRESEKERGLSPVSNVIDDIANPDHRARIRKIVSEGYAL